MNKPLPKDDLPAAMAQRSAPETLKTALHEHLQAIVRKPLSARMLLELGQAAELAGKLLVVSGDPRAIPLGRGHNDLGGFGVNGGVIGPYDLDMVQPIPVTGVGMGSALAPAAFGAPENFGAESIRQMVADLGRPKLRDLIASLGEAEHLLKRNPDSKFYQKLVEKLQSQVNEAAALDATLENEGALRLATRILTGDDAGDPS